MSTNRVGRKRRMSREARKAEVLKCVCVKTYISQKPTTCTSVARRLGLTPSTYLMNILYELWSDSLIDGEEGTNSKGNRVIHWSISPEGVEACS